MEVLGKMCPIVNDGTPVSPTHTYPQYKHTNRGTGTHLAFLLIGCVILHSANQHLLGANKGRPVE